MKGTRVDPVVIVAGPTASGKSGLALALAEVLGGMVVNADSMQVYQDLAILTARPDAAATARAPHRLYGVIDAAEACSAGRWHRLAVAELAAARAAGRVPILTGGTGLYLHALVRGLAAVPPVPAALREEARALHARLGATAFHAAVAELDPEGAARLAVNDAQRLIRAYEVVKATGRPLSEWQRRHEPSPPIAAAAVLLLPPREPLYATCDARFAAMVEQGAVEEVRQLRARGLPPHLPAMKAVGVPELAAWLDGRISREAAVAAAQQATRHYAKRQYTWFRRQMPEAERLRKLTIEAQFSESLLPQILLFIRHFLLTAGA